MHDLELRKARDLKRRSRALRDRREYTEAEELLVEAVRTLRTVLAAADVDTPGVAASPDVRELATELADCLGSLGGIRRRHAEALRSENRISDANTVYEAAIAAYEEGRVLEQDDRFRIANSYNLVQSVVVPVLTKPDALADPQLAKQLGDICNSIERQISTTRPSDPWAYSDLGLIQLLDEKEDKANRTWDKMDDLKPARNVYTSGLPVLDSLASRFPTIEAFRRAAERFRMNA